MARLLVSLSDDSDTHRLRPETQELCEMLEPLIREAFPGRTFRYLGDPFADYGKIVIDGKKKSEYPPVSRVYFRLGLFYPFVQEVEEAFDDGLEIGLVSRYGFDLYAGAVKLDPECPTSLEVHEAAVGRHVRTRPLYLLARELDLCDTRSRTRYFRWGSGQQFMPINPALSARQKAREIVKRVVERSQEFGLAA